MAILEKTRKYHNSGSVVEGNIKRAFTLIIVFLFMFSILFHRLYNLQIVNGQKYAEDYELKTTRVVRDNNMRGMIYDCNGEVLAYNEPVYTVTMTDDGVYSSKREKHLTLNSMIYHVIKKLEENSEQINNELKIELGLDGNYKFTVSGKALDRFKADIFGKAVPADMTAKQRNISAEEMVSYLSSDNKFALYEEENSIYSEEELIEYRLPKEYTKQEILLIVGIRYMLSLNSYTKYVPIVLAKDVSEKTAVYILENKQSFKGIDIGKEWKRVYTGGEAFSHILGYTGKISTEEMDKYNDSGSKYTVDSVVGKAGIEQHLEEKLQGIDGERQITVNNVGKIVGIDKTTRETVKGSDVYLSINKDLQIAVYNILEQNLAGIISSNLINTKYFDKTNISDTSNIRIPIYDVYMALINNSVIKLKELYEPDSTEMEKNMAAALETKKAEIRESLRTELLEGNTDYNNLSEEMQEYISYIVSEMEIINENYIDKEDEVYSKWKRRGGISVKQFLTHCLESGWIKAGFIDTGKGYFTLDEMYSLLVDTIDKKLVNDSEFDKMLFNRMILKEQIKGRDICLLLYEQHVLSSSDSCYEKLMSGETDAFSFLKNKIEQLEITPAQLALDPCSASAVVVQQGTGKVLALVSYPGYDNNRLSNQMDSDYYSQLLIDKSLPLYNRATQQLTAPGSTFKPVTIIAGIQKGVISPNTSVLCDGVFDKVSPVLKCWKHSGHGNVSNVSMALQYSCNDYMCEIAYRMGLENGMEYTDSISLKYLQEYSELFCLNKKSGIEITESKPHVTDAYGIPSSIGQGTHNYATVQLARYVSTIASKGDAFSLSLIKGIKDKDDVFIVNEDGLESKVELSDSVWNAVHLGMMQFAQNNDVLKDMEISVAGKTGTAQEAEDRPDHALFIGFAPTEQPEISVAVRIANGYGSANSTAVAKNIFRYYFNTESQDKIITGEASQAFNTRTD